MPLPITLEPALGEPRDAASVVLLRDTSAGLEVFLMQRSGLSDAFGQAYVFPGGKLDADDSSPTALAALDQTAQALCAALAEPASETNPPHNRDAQTAGLFVAALRELFEEAGVLLSHGNTRPASPTTADWNAWLAQSPGQLHASALHPWSRWITPRMAALSKKRFDTRFFLAALPPGQHAVHDNFETTHSVWLRPREALQRYADGAIAMAPPQIMGLAHLSRFAHSADALRSARLQTPPCICPESGTDNGETFLCYPGDPAHSVPHTALPGPTRLMLRQQRFEPPHGFDSLWR